jgi:hypothetical protein
MDVRVETTMVTMRSAALVLLSCSISVCAALLLVPASRTPEPAPAPDRRIAELIARVDTLEAALRNAPAVQNAEAPPARVLVPDAELAARITALEQSVAALDRRLRSAPEPAHGPPAGVAMKALLSAPQFGDAERLAVQQIVCDPRVEVPDKLALHEKLRGIKDAYSQPMVQTLVQIGSTNADPRVRADVWRFFDGESHVPEIVPALLRTVTQDREAYPREEASETLGNYLSDPTVRAALEQVAANDGDERVRAKAKRTLQMGGRRPVQR